jgi:4-hydroxy-L-threonine phosphate dehydrogenase PdxA
MSLLTPFGVVVSRMSLHSIALFTGDPAGIGPELVQALLNDLEQMAKAKVILIGQPHLLAVPSTVQCHEWSGAHLPTFARGQAQAANGQYMLQALREGVGLVQSGRAQALCFAPLNKGALRLGGMTQEDELRWFAELLKHTGPCGEFNVLDTLWTGRVTSHVALREVSELLTIEKVASAIGMLTRAMRASGLSNPRIAVCGLNPHNGDNGNYGDEEARLIEPGVRLAQEQGYPAHGPFPADTAFVRALRKEGGFDGVVTMYHDQGQIAMKLLGFERGVTVQGGLPIPITTPAHGTAYDIAGKGLANTGAMFNAFDLACRMASH